MRESTEFRIASAMSNDQVLQFKSNRHSMEEMSGAQSIMVDSKGYSTLHPSHVIPVINEAMQDEDVGSDPEGAAADNAKHIPSVPSASVRGDDHGASQIYHNGPVVGKVDPLGESSERSSNYRPSRYGSMYVGSDKKVRILNDQETKESRPFLDNSPGRQIANPQKQLAMTVGLNPPKPEKKKVGSPPRNNRRGIHPFLADGSSPSLRQKSKPRHEKSNSIGRPASFMSKQDTIKAQRIDIFNKSGKFDFSEVQKSGRHGLNMTVN